MAQGIRPSNGHNSVPVVKLVQNPKARTSDQPAAGAVRGVTNLAKDTAGYGTRVTGPSQSKKTR